MSKIPESKSTDTQIYRRLLTYVTPYWLAFLLSIIGFALYSISNVGFAELIGYIVDSLGGDDPLAGTKFADYLTQLFGDTGELNRTAMPILIILKSSR